MRISPREHTYPNAESARLESSRRDLPHGEDKFESSIVSSYRTRRGVCHNPAKDRRTTKGVFHVAEGGLAIAADKLAVPKVTFGRLLKAPLHPPDELLTLPYTSKESQRLQRRDGQIGIAFARAIPDNSGPV